MTKKNLTIYEKAALNYMMVNLATNYAKEYMGLDKCDIPDFDKYIVWNSDSVDVLDGDNDFLEVYNRLGMRSAYIDEDTGLSYIECVVLNDYEPLYVDNALYINDDEVVTSIRVDVDETELEDLDDLIDEVIMDYLDIDENIKDTVDDLAEKVMKAIASGATINDITKTLEEAM